MLLPVLFLLWLAVFLVRIRAQVRRRNAQTWNQLVARLEPNWSARQLGDCLRDQDATPEERWESLCGARGLCAMFQNAKVMLDMADYAAHNGSSVDREILAELRSDAMQIRVSVVMALAQYAMHQVNERICANALHAASMYKDMSARMSSLIDVSSQTMAPQFVGAM